jgi:alanine-synthesizing transaminase
MTRYSNRFLWDLETNRLSQLLAAKRSAGVPLLDLTESNPTRADLQYPVTELQRAFQEKGWLSYEPAPNGLASAREAVAAYYAVRGHAISAERILLTASTSEAYSYLFKLLADPGDEVLVPRPSYPLFEFLAALEAVRPVHYSLSYHGEWRIDFDSLRAGLSPRSRAVVIVNPNNPTGSFLKADERGELLKFCAEHGLALISDEVFSDYVFDPHADNLVPTVADESGILAFSLSGLSKVAGMPQMKAGWIIVSGPAEDQHHALTRLELIADTYLSVSSPVQHALPKLLELGGAVQEQIRQRVRQNLQHLIVSVSANSPARLLAAEGGWYATLEVPRVRSEEQWTVELLEHDNVIVQPGYFYDFEREAFLVLSLLTLRETFAGGIERLLARIGQ